MAYTHHDWERIAKDHIDQQSNANRQKKVIALANLLKGMHALGRYEGTEACREACVGEAICDKEIANSLLPPELIIMTK